jgi:hypothetical protein
LHISPSKNCRVHQVEDKEVTVKGLQNSQGATAQVKVYKAADMMMSQITNFRKSNGVHTAGPPAKTKTAAFTG